MKLLAELYGAVNVGRCQASAASRAKAKQAIIMHLVRATRHAFCGKAGGIHAPARAKAYARNHSAHESFTSWMFSDVYG